MKVHHFQTWRLRRHRRKPKTPAQHHRRNQKTCKFLFHNASSFLRSSTRALPTHFSRSRAEYAFCNKIIAPRKEVCQYALARFSRRFWAHSRRKQQKNTRLSPPSMAFVNNLLGKYLSFFYKKAAGPHLPCSGVSDLAIGNFLPDKKSTRLSPLSGRKAGADFFRVVLRLRYPAAHHGLRP